MTFPTKDDVTTKNILMYSFIALFGLLALSIVMRLLPVAIFLFIILAPPIFVLSDAQERQTDRPVLWGVFTLFTSVFGLVVYLLVRPDKVSNCKCGNCNGNVEESFVSCPWCGEKLEKVIKKCPECSANIQKGWKFCPECQAEIKKPETKKEENPDGTTTVVV